MTDLDKKRIDELNIFLHKAFCVEGAVNFSRIIESHIRLSDNERYTTKLTGTLHEINDEKRGKFYVAIYKEI